MSDLKEKICPSNRASCRYGYGDNVCDNCNKMLDEYIAEHDKQIRAEAIDECIKTLAKSEDTILSDRQYYTLMKLKEQK